MKIIRNLLISTLLLFSGMCYSQSDEKPVALLDEVAAKIESYSTLKIEFIVYIENNQGGNRDPYSGSAMYKAGNYKLDMMGQIVFSDGKTNWTYLKDADEVNITKNTEGGDIMVNPKNLLKDYKNNFKITQISDKFEKNRPLVEIDLYPKKIDDKKYSRITLKIDKTKKQIYSIRYVGKDGINYLIEISKFIENPAIQDSEIKFSNSLFPDAEIIDMRE
ncbi:MAG: outer membrane lipoprotein carrier protein LolA [Bacteroidales bacterium]|jgi:outer membrane lipoprotein-sorting protein|nr:outer membrane lipoprotein carrier protein LolA [Bacteroidales bacterium]